VPGVPAEIFVEPSAEARRLLKHAGWLVSPRREGGPGAFLRMVLVAPFTQLTFLSFDLQMFLFEVFHLTRWARAGHLLGMLGVNFFLMAGLWGLPLAGPRWLNGAALYALVLLVWYAAIARSARLLAWWLGVVPVVVALFLGAGAFRDATAGQGASGWASPWLWMLASAAFVAFSHAPEPQLPPRAIEGQVWRPLPAALRGAPGVRPSPRTLLRNGVRIGLFLVWGTLDELWAAPRLLPYNFLRFFFLLGYAPERWAEIQRWSARAVASGNPALDFVGIGGATFLARPDPPA